MMQGRASPGFHGIKPWLCDNLVDLNTTAFTTYDDKRLMACSGAVIVVGTARRITQETIGFPPRRQGSKAIVRELISAEFTKKNGRFEELDRTVQEALLLEASVFGGIPNIVTIFYQTAFEIYNSSLRASDQTSRLIEVWQQRSARIRDRTGG
jgi:hypothetical protein